MKPPSKDMLGTKQIKPLLSIVERLFEVQNVLKLYKDVLGPQAPCPLHRGLLYCVFISEKSLLNFVQNSETFVILHTWNTTFSLIQLSNETQLPN